MKSAVIKPPCELTVAGSRVVCEEIERIYRSRERGSELKAQLLTEVLMVVTLKAIAAGNCEDPPACSSLVAAVYDLTAPENQ